ncbi:MAG: cytochrome c oxidase subunit 4 [Planctomycetaceae bacterium]
MTTWGRYLLAITAYGLISGTIYWFLTYEWAGAILLWVLALVPAVIWLYAARRGLFRARTPEDDPGGDPSAGSGEEVGEFPATTAWPAFLVLGVIATGASIVYGLILLPIGIGVLGWSVLGLMRESKG